MITQNYYGNNSNMNTGKFNTENSKYNFTNQKPAPFNPNKMNQGVYSKKPKTSSNINRPVNPDALKEAQLALRSLKLKMSKKQMTPNKPIPQNNIIRSNTSNQHQRPITRQEPTNQIRQPQFGNNNYDNINNMYQKYENTPKTTIGSKKPIMYDEPNEYPNTNNHNNYNSNYNEDRQLDKGENNSGMQKAVLNAGEGEPTYPCPDCGRSFVQATLEKHIKICKKVFMKKRKAFDMKEARKNSDLEQFEKEKEMEGKYGGKNKKNQKNTQTNNKKSDGIPKWKKQSEELRNIIKATAEMGNTGGKAFVMPTPSSVTDDYSLCKFCNRKYNEEAYNKHLPGCERRFKEAQMKSKYSKGGKQNNQMDNKYRKK